MVSITESTSETQKLGEKFAIGLNFKGRSATVVCMSGDLGSGKTTFVQGFARGLGIKKRIVSPTYILQRRYEVIRRAQKSTFEKFYHFDLYRLEKNIKDELINLGFDEVINDPANVVLVEWAEKAKSIMPKNSRWINFDILSLKKRRIEISEK